MYCLPPCYDDSGDETDDGDDFNCENFKWEQKAETQYKVSKFVAEAVYTIYIHRSG